MNVHVQDHGGPQWVVGTSSRPSTTISARHLERRSRIRSALREWPHRRTLRHRHLSAVQRRADCADRLRESRRPRRRGAATSGAKERTPAGAARCGRTERSTQTASLSSRSRSVVTWASAQAVPWRPALKLLEQDVGGQRQQDAELVGQESRAAGPVQLQPVMQLLEPVLHVARWQ